LADKFTAEVYATAMFRDPIQWQMIRNRVLKGGIPKRQVLRETGIHWATLEKMLKHPFPPKYKRKGHSRLRKLCLRRLILPTKADIVAGIKHKIIESAVFIQDMFQAIPRDAVPVAELHRLARFLKDRGFGPVLSSKSYTVDSANHQWMQQVLHKKLSVASIQSACSTHPEIEMLLKMAWSGSLWDRKKAIVVLAKLKGISALSIQRFIKGSGQTIQQYWEKFQSGGVARLFARKHRPKQSENQELRSAFFALLHSPPSLYGINRTTWKWDDLVRCLREEGYSVWKGVLREMVKAEGYKWRTAKVVLTSEDPRYREKLNYLKSVLANLRKDERFFSVDEFGPFSIKMKGGRRLVGPHEHPEVPQYQKSKGCLILTAALELSRNQVTHFYSKRKNSLEMLRLLEVLVNEYKHCKKLYFSWDAASWHASERVYETVRYHNAMAEQNHRPLIELVPLPASAQFLNVIESVFSGMAKAIIHNSDYQCEDEAKAAIDRYFQERNEHFRRHPKRAGNKVWGQERVSSVFTEGQNCKDPKYAYAQI
jgi:transposase